MEVENAALKSENLVLKQQNAALEIRLNQHSGNSHKPPSTDGFKKQPALPKAKSKPTGGQAGHQGHTLQMVEAPDMVVLHHASGCSCCGKAFTSSQVHYIEEKRQIFELPAVKLQVTEHQLGVIYCCGKAHRGSFPSAVKVPAAYGQRLHAMASLLNVEYRMPLEKVSQLLEDLYGCSYNESTLCSANARVYVCLQPVEEQIKQQLLESAVVHADETGLRVEGRLHWVHRVCSFLCYLFVHPNRGGKALYSEASLLNDFKHRAIHDCWKTYFSFEQCSHALCNAHLIRELTGLQEQGSQWAKSMKSLLLELYKESQRSSYPLTNKEVWLEKYKTICQQAEVEEPVPEQKVRGRPKNSIGRNLLNRLMQHQEAVLAFAFEKDVPFTNNLAEQAIRCVKIKQKVAMSFRTFTGAQIFARIQGFVATCRKQKISAFQQLVEVLNGNIPVFQTC